MPRLIPLGVKFKFFNEVFLTPDKLPLPLLGIAQHLKTGPKETKSFVFPSMANIDIFWWDSHFDKCILFTGCQRSPVASIKGETVTGTFVFKVFHVQFSDVFKVQYAMVN